jgi:hypothetical protein
MENNEVKNVANNDTSLQATSDVRDLSVSDRTFTTIERQLLAQEIKSEGFRLTLRVLEDVVRTMSLHLLSVDPADEKKVVARHRIAIAASHLYKLYLNRLVNETQTLQPKPTNGTPTNPEKPEYYPPEFDTLGGLTDEELSKYGL